VLPQAAGFLDFGGELLDARHNSPLLVEWREGDLDLKEKFRAYPVLPAGAARFLVTLLPALLGLGEPMEPARVEFHGVRNEGRKLAGDIAARKRLRNDSYAAIPCPDFVDDDVASLNPREGFVRDWVCAWRELQNSLVARKTNTSKNPRVMRSAIGALLSARKRKQVG
jgi:hypothetical protein